MKGELGWLSRNAHDLMKKLQGAVLPLAWSREYTPARPTSVGSCEITKSSTGIERSAAMACRRSATVASSATLTRSRPSLARNWDSEQLHIPLDWHFELHIIWNFRDSPGAQAEEHMARWTTCP